MDEKELRALRFQIILSMLNEDPDLAEQIKVYLS